ncbi:M42 family metallopeptidase [Mycoplasmatota bacterium zrk1]
MNNKDLYYKLFDLPGVAGGEHFVKDFVKSELEKYSDEIVMDKIGGVFGIKHGPKGSPVVMFAGHMDEVGAIVVGFKENGLIKMKSLGGMNGKVFSSQHMNVILEDGTKIPGITGTVPPHLKEAAKNADEFDDLLLDIGADNEDHAKELGIKIGDMIVPENRIVETIDGKKVISKAVDDRWGCGMVIELMKDIKDLDLNCTVVAGCTVQEEVGLRGAQTASQMINPDIFIALDASPCGDVIKSPQAWGKFGDGFLLRFLDRVAVMHKGMKKLFIETAKDNDIKYQYFYSAGGTDAGKAQLSHSGIAAATIGLPTRYIHSTTSMFHEDDHEAAKAIVRALVKKIDTNVLKEVHKNV